MPTVRILQGHVLDTLRQLPNQSVHCCITSPPYWGLRSYQTEPQIWGGTDECEHVWGADMPKPGSEYREGLSTSIFAGREDKGEIRKRLVGNAPSEKSTLVGGGKHRPGTKYAQNEEHATGGQFCQRCGAAWRGELGSEPTPELFVEHLVQVFREVRRVMRDDAVAWVNMGDSYNAMQGNGFKPGGGRNISAENIPKPRKQIGLKPKDLCGMPWRLAFALQAEGWYLRSDIIWAKPNPMPESVTDRPTKSHEYVFLLTKSAKYYYDATAVKEPLAESTLADGRNATGRHTQGDKEGSKYGADGSPDQPSWYRSKTFVNPCGGRNLRSVWTIPTEANPLAHFAAFPRRLVEPCIMAGTSEKGVCRSCGSPWTRVVEKRQAGETLPEIDGTKNGDMYVSRYGAPRLGPGIKDTVTTISWRPTCSCPAADPVPATVLDCFHGSGTTMIVSIGMNRSYVGIELNPEYVKMSRKRLRERFPLFTQEDNNGKMDL